MVIEIGIAGIPTRPNENRRLHWSARAKDEKIWRNSARLSALDALRRSGHADDYPLRRAAIEYVFVLERASGDLDGLVAAAKPLLDGIVEAGVLVDDRVGVLVALSSRWVRGPRKGVIIRIREVGERTA
jgi:hypothetical protein